MRMKLKNSKHKWEKHENPKKENESNRSLLSGPEDKTLQKAFSASIMMIIQIYP